MRTNDGILVATLVLLVAFVIFQCSPRGFGARRGHDGGASEGFTPAAAAADDDPHHKYRGGRHNPYTVLNKQIGAIRGHPHHGYNQPPLWRQPHGLDRYHRSGASLKPHDISVAERAAWYGYGAAETFDAEKPHAPQPVDSGPGMDYGSFVADLIVEPRIRENHRKWAAEMKPWSGALRNVDDHEEAMEATSHFVGLRRSQPVAQYNPHQLTERDTYTFAGNHKFNFRG